MKSLRLAYNNVIVFIHRHKLNALVDVFIFALITIVFHILWWDFYGWITQLTFITSTADWLARAVYLSAHWFNKHILLLSMTTSEPNTMWFSNGSHVSVDEGCSGLKQFYQIAVLFILFPGPWKHKLWFIPAGFVVMFFINVLRIIILSLFALHWPQYWDFMHEWVLRTFFYVVIFALWVIWVEKFRRRRKTIPIN